MPACRKDLLDQLTALEIGHETVEHPPIFTVDEGRELKTSMPGGHSKNLFLKDKRGDLFLAVARAEISVDLVGLGKTLGAKGRLSFGKPDLMTATLGVIPGAVTPFSLINETAEALSAVILDNGFFEFDRLWFHPLENTASTSISPADLLKFMRHCGVEPRLIDLCDPVGAS